MSENRFTSMRATSSSPFQEQDPTVPSWVKAITQSDISNWNGKQASLTAGSNISISGNTISATDTTYNDFVGTDGSTAGTAGLVPAPATTDSGKYLKADGSWATPSGSGEMNVIESISVNTVAQTVVNKNVDITVPQMIYSTTDLTAGTSALATGTYYFVYE